jgi:hypothetical protein
MSFYFNILKRRKCRANIFVLPQAHKYDMFPFIIIVCLWKNLKLEMWFNLQTFNLISRDAVLFVIKTLVIKGLLTQ